jgi:16S rRNA (cytosine967-C5)-methyltransferase
MAKPGANNPRLAAVQALADVLDRGQSLADTTALDHGLERRNSAMARHLVYETLRWLTALEWLAGQLLQRPLKPRDKDIKRLILIGIAQLWRADTAPHAAINETAECARLLGKPWAVGLVNAVLRRFQRQGTEWIGKLEAREERLAHPEWLLQRLRQDWPDRWREIAAANNRPAGLWLRVNRASTRRESAVNDLEQGGFEVVPHRYASAAIRVTPPVPVTELPGFDQGQFSVQDPAAQLAAAVLSAQPGHRVLDACAAPGGKTCHVLEQAPGLSLTAIDKSNDRLSLLRQNLERLGLDCDMQAADASKPSAWWDGVPFNRILLDAPCTATGVIRRHPEIKWLRTPEQLEAAVHLQEKLLRQLWPLLETGGMLVYATCSVLKDENERQIRRFVERHPDAQPVELDVDWGVGTDGPGRQILPGDEDMDGFYYARLRKLA